MIKPSSVLLGLLGSAAIAVLPIAAQAQSFDPFPAADCTGVVINFICRGELPNGIPALYAIPSGYEGRYVLGTNLIPGGNLVFMYDNVNKHISTYIYIGDSNRTNLPDAGGNLRLLEEVEDEVVAIVIESRL